MAARGSGAGAQGTGGGFASIDANGVTELVVPGGPMLLRGAYEREGPDLTVTDPGGNQVLVQDYFTQAEPPVLLTEGGAKVGPELAAKLAGPETPGQYAQAEAGLGEQPIGTVDSFEGTVTATRADGTTAVLGEGDPVFQGDVIETAGEATVNVVLIDDSTFAMDEDGRMVIGDGAFSVVQGTFSFVSGEIAKSGPDAMVVDTPVANIGIRGTKVAIKVGIEGEDTVITLLEEEGGYVGEIVISNDAGTQVLNIANQTTQVASFSSAPTEPQVLDRGTLEQLYGSNFAALLNQDFGAPDEEGAAGEEAVAEEEEVLDEEVGEEEAAEEDGKDVIEGEEVLQVEDAIEVAEIEEDAIDVEAAEEGDELSADEFPALQEIAPAAGGDGGLDIEIGGPPPTPTPASDTAADEGAETVVVAPPPSVALTVSVAAAADAPSITTGPASGDEDTTIALDIAASLGDVSGSEVLSVTVAGVPAGASLSAGTDNGDGTWTLTAADLGGLTITPPPDSSADFTLQVGATATKIDPDSGVQTTATTSGSIGVTMRPVADAPSLDLDAGQAGDPLAGTASGVEDGEPIPLDLAAAVSDPSEVLSLTITGVPPGATLSAGSGDGAGTVTFDAADLTALATNPLTLTPARDFSGSFDLAVTAVSTENDDATATTSGTISVNVIPVADEDLTLVGTDSADTLIGGSDNDDISGLGGDDTLFGNVGDDRLDGGPGDDALFGGTGADTLDGGKGDDVLKGGTGNDALTGGGGGDTLRGGEGSDTLDGGKGDDMLFGDSGDDVIGGGGGGDTLVGGIGADTLTGGKGGDKFEYDSLADSGDFITDFDTGKDSFVFDADEFGRVRL